MNTIEEISEISEIHDKQLNGNSSTIKTKITSTTTSSSSSNSASAHTSPKAAGGNINGSKHTNGDNTSSSDDYLDDLKIIGHLKNIEKLNEKRRVFLSNTITSEYSSDEKTECIDKSAASTTKQAENGNDIGFSNYNAKNTLVREQRFNNTTELGHSAAAATTSTLSQKYATLPLKTPRTPNTPPPKPPMLSRTRSIGAGDSHSMSSPPPMPKFPAPLSPSPQREQYTNIQIQPTESTIVTASTLAEPLKVTCVHLQPETEAVEESAAVILRSSISKSNMNGEIDAVQSVDVSSRNSVSVEATKDIHAKHYERLIEELKCPGCAVPMKTPIYLCRTGHSVCDQCTRILMLCPLCKEPFTNIRSLTVEALCSKAHFKCTNSSGGCTVRLQIDLLTWHEKQCIYKPMKCFMGRVWGDCQWNGREAFWKEHLESEHSNKIFHNDTVNLIWNMGVKQRPLTGYYVFQVFNEMFNFYEIYDKERILFTMTCTSTQKEKKLQFAYEVTLINEDIEALSITQKFPVHSEYDADILAEGTCVNFPITDLAKFLDEERLLHYRIRILEVKNPRRSRVLRGLSPNSGKLPIDFQQTHIEGVNLKNVPSDIIVTRRTDEIPFVDNDSLTVASTFAGSSDDEIEKSKREFYEKLEAKKKRDSGSDTDPEFEAFIAQKWGTPQLNFNRKYLKGNQTSSDGSSSTSPGDSPKNANDDKISITSTSYKKRMSNTLRKSFRTLKTDLIEMKPFGKKSSPEKKLM